MIKAIYATLDRNAQATLPTLARLTFAAVLCGYYWNSAMTKLDGFGPSLGAFAQILPRRIEAAGYDASALGLFDHLIVIAGTWAEFILPALIVLGLLTRPAALGMIGFIIVQTMTDLWGHRLIDTPDTLGRWFDRIPDSAIADQRLLWVMLLTVPLLSGAGPLSLDRLFSQARRS